MTFSLLNEHSWKRPRLSRCHASASSQTLSPISLSPLYSPLEQQIEFPPKPEASAPFPATTEPSVAAERPVGRFTAPASDAAAAVDGIDLAKIGSILNSLSSVMKSAGERSQVSVRSRQTGSKCLGQLSKRGVLVALFFLDVAAESPPVAVPAESSVKAAPGAPQDATSLVNLLSKVDVSPVDLLSALSKVQKQSSFDGESLSPHPVME